MNKKTIFSSSSILPLVTLPIAAVSCGNNGAQNSKLTKKQNELKESIDDTLKLFDNLAKKFASDKDKSDALKLQKDVFESLLKKINLEVLTDAECDKLMETLKEITKLANEI